LPWDGDIGQIVRFAASTLRPPPRYDRRKDWDVELSREVIEGNVGTESLILDVGCFNSAILWTLLRRGFTRLCGLDLNPLLRFAPHNRMLWYVAGDLYAAPFLSRRFEVVTALSMMEHGFEPAQFLPALRRLLKPGGLLIVSTDYWPDKIETTGIRVFGQPWTIFSRPELEHLLEDAKAHGFYLEGPADWTVGDRVIHWQGRHYTFVHIVWRVQIDPRAGQ
jgi:SAM-dependent methyltransferase